MRVAIGLLLVLGSSTAFAQAPASLDPATAPPFITLDRQDGTSRVGGELGYLSVNGGGDGTALHFDAHGQYINPQGIGGYVQLPIANVSGNGFDTVTALGDLEVGGIYIATAGKTRIIAHAGVTLPTASDDGDKAVDGLLVQAASRLTDLYQTIPKGTSVRFGVSPMFRSGQIFGRIDVGLDANLDAAGNNSADSFLHFNGGVGYQLGTASVMAELVNMYISSNNGGWLNMGAISARFATGDIMPYAGLLIPLDDDTQSIIDLTVLLGIDVALH